MENIELVIKLVCFSHLFLLFEVIANCSTGAMAHKRVGISNNMA
jgi:hypothetical protein